MSRERRELTLHATQEYMERYEPELSFEEARDKLAVLFEEARPLRARTKEGTEQYQNGEILFVCKRDTGNRLVAVTLHEFRRGGTVLDPTEEALRRLRAEAENHPRMPVTQGAPSTSDDASFPGNTHDLLNQLAAMKRQLHAQKERADAQHEDAVRAKQAIRLAVAAIEEPTFRVPILRAIRAIAPVFLDEAFLQKNAAEDRQKVLEQIVSWQADLDLLFTRALADRPKVTGVWVTSPAPLGTSAIWMWFRDIDADSFQEGWPRALDAEAIGSAVAATVGRPLRIVAVHSPVAPRLLQPFQHHDIEWREVYRRGV